MAEGAPNVPAAHCPNCGAEYRAGFDTCADDGTKLEPGPAPPRNESQDEEPNDAWSDATDRIWNRPHVATSKHPVPAELCQLPRAEAHLLLGLLDAAGIEADVQDSLSAYGFGNAAFPSRVFVNRDQLEQARAIYAEFNERQGYE